MYNHILPGWLLQYIASHIISIANISLQLGNLQVEMRVKKIKENELQL